MSGPLETQKGVSGATGTGRTPCGGDTRINLLGGPLTALPSLRDSNSTQEDRDSTYLRADYGRPGGSCPHSSMDVANAVWAPYKFC